MLLGLLGISAALLSLGQGDDRAIPAADSYGPSGVSAFAQLLRQNGYLVRVDMRPRPRIEPNEVAVGFSLSADSSTSSNQADGFEASLKKQLKEGRRAILLSVQSDFHDRSVDLLKSDPVNVSVRGRPDRLRMMVSKTIGESSASLFEEEERSDEDPSADASTNSAGNTAFPSVGLWESEGGVVLRAFRLGKGTLLYAPDGSFVTNRFLDRAGDAQAALQLVRLIARPGEAIVFTEASFGNVDEPGLLESIGGWADAGWQQCIFLFVVVIFTLGKRFGLPDESRPPQRGARELLEALTDTYTRGRQTRAAMSAALERINAELRSGLRLPRDATKEDRDRLLPPELVSALARLQVAIEMQETTSASQALELIRSARIRAEEFVGGGRTPLRRTRPEGSSKA